jgi:hypothetical protein
LYKVADKRNAGSGAVIVFKQNQNIPVIINHNIVRE